MGKYDSFLDTPSSAGKYDAFLDEGTEPPAKQNTGIVGDIGTALKRGVLQMPGMATGLADIAAAPVSIATGVNRPVSRAADWIGEQTGFQPGKWAEAASAEYSPEMQQAQQNVEQAKGFFPTLGAVAQNPRMILPVVGESLPSTIAGGLVARGAMGAVAGAEKLAAIRTAAGSADAAVANAARRELLKSGAIAAGVGEGAVTAGQQMAQTGYDVDPALAAGAAIGAGVGTGIIGGLSGRVAGSALGRKLGLSDIETSMAAGTLGENAGKAGAAGLANRIGAGAIQEGLLEEAPQSYQEQVWQNLAAGKPLTEGAAEAAALGAVAGGVMGGGVNAISGPLSKAVAASPGAGVTPTGTPAGNPTVTGTPAGTPAGNPPQDTLNAERISLEQGTAQSPAGIASAAQFPQFTAPPQPVTGGAPLEQAPTVMPVPQATQNAPAAPGSPSPAITAELPSPANAAESAGAPVQQPQGPLPSANQTEVAIPSAQGPEAAALPVAAKPSKTGVGMEIVRPSTNGGGVQTVPGSGIAAALQYPQQVTEGGGPLAQQAADMPLGRFGERPKKPDISPDIPAKKATKIASSSGIAGALVTPQQPTFGGTPLERSPVAMPIGEYGKRAQESDDARYNRIRSTPPGQRSAADVSFANAYSANKRKPAELAREAEENAKTAEKNDTDGFAESVGQSPARQQNIRNALNTLTSSNGRTTTRKQLIRSAVTDGATVGTREGQRALIRPDGSHQLLSALTKTAIDYAEYLIARGYVMSPKSVSGTSPKPLETKAVASSQTPPDAPQQTLSSAGERQPAKTGEEAIRAAAEAVPNRTIGSWYPINVTFNGKTQPFLSNIKRVVSDGKTLPSIILVQIRRGRMLAGDPLQPLFRGYRLSRDNKITDDGIVRPASDAEVARWNKSFPEHQVGIEDSTTKPRQQPKPAPRAQQSVITSIARRDDIIGDILRLTNGDGISSSIAGDVTGEKAGKNLPRLIGLFTDRGSIDLGYISGLLNESGYNIKDDNELISLIRQTELGNTQKSAPSTERDLDAERDARHRDYIRQNAKKLKIKSVAVKFTDLEQRVIAALTRRHERAVELLDERAKKRFDAALEESYALLPEDVVDAVLVDVNGRGLKTLEFWKEATTLLRYMVADAKAQKEQEELNAIEGDEPDWLKDDDGRGNQPAGGGEEVDRVVEEARGEAEFNLAAQTPEEIAAAEAEAKATEAKAEKEKKAAEDAQKKAELTAEVKKRSEAAADTFELGGNAMDNLTGQKDIFAAPAPVEPKPAAKEVIGDIGEKIGGARKDMAASGVSGGSRKNDDSRPAWARRFEISQIVTPGGMIGQVPDSGRWVIRDGKNLDWRGAPKQVGSTFATKEEAESFIPIAAVSLKHRVVMPSRSGEQDRYEIWRDISDRKRVKIVDKQFDSRDEAMRYMLENAVQIIETNTTFGEADIPLPPNKQRSGPARRTGNVSGEDFKNTFGLRGVEFGNWNNQDDRQSLMNDAWDGLMDLADVIGIPAKALGLNGDLALAFGARGQGLNSARAHYEGQRVVINLTKEKGAGSLAHEWFHAMDHYFGRQDGKAAAEWQPQADGTRILKGEQGGEKFISSGFGYKSNVRPELREAYDALMKTIFKKAETYVEDTAKADKFTGTTREELARQLDALRKELSEQKDPKYWKRNNKPASAELLAEFDTIAKAMIDGDVMAITTDWRMIKPAANKARAMPASRWTNDSLERLSAIYKEVRGRSGFDGTNKQGVMDRLGGYMNRYSQRLKMLADAQAGAEKRRMVPTSFAMNAKELDQGRGGDYWTTPHEMAARAFQGYVEDKVAERGGTSRFLNYAPENAGILTPWGAKLPFPAGQERKAINAALDKFVGAMQTKEGEDGGVILFSQESPSFYSQLSGAIASARVTSQPAEQWKAWINGNAGNLGIKKDEIEWSGILDYLDVRGKGKVTKAEIADYLSGNGVRVEDVVKGAPDSRVDAGRKLAESQGHVWDDLSARDQGRYIRSAAGEPITNRGETDTKFDGYWQDSYKGGIPGTYREILVTLPDSGPTAEALDPLIRMLSNWPRDAKTAKDPARQSELDDLNAEWEKISNRPKFKSNHWDEPNVLVHIRTDEVIGADGKRYLRVGEIQSDWGQKGKKEGFAGEKVKAYQVSIDGNPVTSYETREEADAHAARAAKYNNPGSIKVTEVVVSRNDVQTQRPPSAPFVTDTRAWAALGIKRAIIHAINSGVDGVVFGTGEQNANLYDLSKQVSRVAAKKSGESAYDVRVYGMDGMIVDRKKSIQADELEDYIGKDIAKRIIDDVENTGLADYQGLDLKVGGEGMRAFYDQIIPSVANDVLKKVGGGRVESVLVDIIARSSNGNMEAGDFYDRQENPGFKMMAQPGFAITPQMRAKIQSQGVPLFSFAGQQSATADQFQLDRAKQLLADGANANSVRQQTGWFKNPSDGKWRYEIDDSGASLKAHGFGFGELLDALGKNLTLAEVLDHPALFAAYPSIARSSVEAIDEKSQNNGELITNKDGGFTIRVNAGLGEAKALSVMLHEIQHGIQNVEGFASGGSPRTISAEMTGRSDDLAKAGSALNSAITAVRSANGNQAYRDILAAVRADGYRYSHIAFQLGTIDDDLSDVAMLVSEIAKKKGYKELFNAAEAYSVIADNLIKPGQGIDRDKAAYEKYRKLAGEVESRNVQQRQNFPADKRRLSDPLGTQDVAPEDVIVMFNGKDAKDAPAPANTTRASAMAAVGASPADAAVFDMASEGRSAQEILAFLSKASRRPFNRVLAAALSRIGVSSTVSIDPAAGWRNSQNRQGAKFAASYSPKTDTISLFTPREAERHILHEFVHAASLKAIARGGPAARQMQAIFDYVQKTGTMSDQYGMGNFARFQNETDAQFKKRALDEFTAELFTNPQFQVRLKQLPAPSGSKLKSAWDWIVRVIANLLGLKTRAQETAMDRALSVGAALLQENAALTMPPVAGTRYHTTWHGSPHKFYTFDLSKIGTGEGAQAYGHGLYVAEAPGVAEGYAGMRPAAGVSILNGKEWQAETYAQMVGEARARGAGSYEKGIASLEKDFQKAVDAREASVADDFQNAIDALRSMQKSGVDLNIGQNFYKVDLPAEAVARMLDWDAALSNQPPEVQSELKNAGIADVDKWTDAGLKGRELYNRAKRGAPAKLPLSQHDDQAFASERLKQAGIPGIRYLDQQSRSGEKATYNFVLFDDKLARIIEVNGVETGVQPWAPGEWEATRGGERFSQEQPFSGREAAATPLKPGTKTLMVDGVERPALNSNGKPIHWSEEGARNFWRWFQNSAVTDADGRPRSVFHGSKTKGAAIKSFDLQKSGTNTDSGWMGKGFYFGDETTADVYAGHYEFDPGHFPQGGVVYPSYLLLKNPLTLIDSDRNDGPRTMVREAFDMADSATADEVRSALIAAGHDGVIYQRTFAERSYREYAALHPEQVKSSAGNTGAFSEDPDIRYSLATNWQQSPVAPGNLYQAAKKKAAGLLTPERLDKVIYEMQDKFIDLRRIRDHIKEIGGTITDLNDAYLGEELYHKRLAYRTEQFLKEELQPFFADMKARGVEMPELEKFLHARHAPEANAEMAKRNPNQKQIDAGRQKSSATVRALELNLQTAKARGLATAAIEKALNDARAELVRWNGAQAFKGTEAERLSLSGMSNVDASTLMASLTPAQRADMNALAAKVDAINDGTLQTLERYGLMDKTALNTWRKTYQHYVPLHRDEAHPDSASHPIGQGFNVRGDASKRRTGSNQEVTNIFSHIAMQREAALTRGEKNRVMQKLYLMARQNQIPEIWSVGKVPMIDTIDKATGFVRSVPDPQYKDKPKVITLRIGGKDVAIVMNEYNPQALRLAQSIKNLDVDDLHYLIPVVGKATRWFASINTQYNPIFGLINFARDVQTAALNLSTTAIAGKQKEVFKDTMSILGDIIKNKGRMPTAGKWAPIYKEFNEVGGTTGYRDLFLTAEDRSKAVTDEIKALDRGKVSQAAHAVAGWLSDYNEAMENATRLAAYKAAIDNGMSKERAASLAKNLTVNFNRKGRQTRELGALYAFFNAAVQGTARMAQTLSGPAGKKIMLGGVLAGAASAMAGIAAMGGGDGEDDEWSKIPEFIKERSLIIPSPFSKEGYFAIPMPLGFHFLPNIGRLMVEMAAYKDKTLGKQMASLFTVLADAFNPLGGSAPPMQIIAPTVMDPFIALAQNKDWTGKPIYVENFNSLNPQPGAARAKDSATPIANGLADAINAVTGGTKYVPGAWSPTPDQIDYVIGQLTGGVGRELGKLSSTIAAPFSGDELPSHKIPLLGRLYGSTAGATGQAGKFYENIKRANEVENELKGRRKDGISVDDYLQDNPKAVELAARGNAAERQIRALRQMRSRIVEAGGDDAASKARQINERMATVMRGFNMQVERMQ